MSKRRGTIGWFGAALLICLTGACASVRAERVVPSADNVPLGDWSYDAMTSLAAGGLVPNTAARLFAGDRLFDRLEMARALGSTIERAKDMSLSSEQMALIGKLVKEFLPELKVVSADVLADWTSIAPEWERTSFAVMGHIDARITQDDAADDAVTMPYRVSAFADLSEHIFAMATAANKEETFFHKARATEFPDKAFVKGYDGNVTWSVGREYVNCGPVYSGSMSVSDNSGPGFLQAGVSKEINFGKLIGRMKLSQFLSTFHDEKTVYLFCRRAEKPMGRGWYLGITELGKMNSTPNPLLLVMPLYLYEYMDIQKEEDVNALYSVDVSYVFPNNAKVYGEVAIDDLDAPRFIGDAAGGRTKAGFVLGAYLPDALTRDRTSTLRMEYIYANQYLYTPTSATLRPELAFTHNGEYIGSPVGPNATAIYVRTEQSLSSRLSLIGEYLNQWQTNAGDPQRGSSRAVSLQVSYDLDPSKSLSFRVAPYRSESPNGVVTDSTLYEGRIRMGF